MKRALLTSTAAFVFVALFSASNAFADSLSDCGDINVEANAKCQVMAEGGCSDFSCSPVNCSASLYAECKGTCDIPDVECEGSCQGTCVTKCEAQGSIDCKGDCNVRCEGSCEGDCAAECESSGDKSSCQASCEGTCRASCSGECSAKCEVVPPKADCKASCEGSCKGSCTVKGSLGCQMECRTKGEAKCTGGCKAACSKPEAALFCDGQYIDHGGHLDSCVNALKTKISATVEMDAHAEGSASCSDGSCEAEGKAEATASCATAKAPRFSSLWGLGLFGAIAAGAVVRRRRKLG